MTIIAKKIAFYTDSFGNDPTNPNINLAAHVCAKLPGTTFDAQQTGGQGLYNAYHGLTPTGAPGWLGGLTMSQHTEMVQPDTIVIHLGYNDSGPNGAGDPYISGASSNPADSYVAYMLALYGQSAATSGRKIAVIQAPATVVADSAYASNPTDPAVLELQARIGRLQQVLDAAVNQINSVYPGAAKLIHYRAPGAIDPVTMGTGSTSDGLHPTLAKHLEISHSIATEVGYWRGWPVLA